MKRKFAIRPAGKATRLIMLLAGLPFMGGMLLAVLGGYASKSLPEALAMTALIGVIGAGLYVALFRRLHLAIDDGQLRLGGGLFSSTVRIADLDLDGAMLVNLDERRELRPFWRLLGVGLPGYRVGHYRTRDRRRAFCLITDLTRVLRIEKHNGHLLMISAERPKELLAALHAEAHAADGQRGRTTA